MSLRRSKSYFHTKMVLSSLETGIWDPVFWELRPLTLELPTHFKIDPC
jgi:hypothetical protein